MPIAKFQLPDGKVARFEVPEGTTPEQAQTMMTAHFSQQQPAMEPKQQSWGDVAGSAVANFIPSVTNVAKGVGEAVLHPIDTAKGVLDIGAGALQNALPEGLVKALGEDKASREKASAVGQFYKQRYGSEEGLKKAIAEDPAGVLADASSVLTGGGGLVSKLPGMAGKVGQAVVQTGASIDPLVMALRGGSKVADVAGSAAKGILGKTSGVGSEAIGEAFRAGAVGGDTAKQLADNMRGKVAKTDVLEDVRQNLEAMNKQKQAEYRSGMVDIRKDQSVLNFGGIDKSLGDAFNRVSFKGQIKDAKAADALQKVNDAVSEWKNLDPAEFHTPEGMDALKQQVGAILESVPYENANTRAVVGDVYHSIKNEINKQAPTYAKVMKDYAEASEEISQIKKTLSQNPKASVDTQMRKLQSIMRNNVNTNYGQRLDLVKGMEQAGGNQVVPALAGQALNEWTPRGLQGAAVAPSAMIGYTAGGAPLAAGMAVASSPRLVGEAALASGRLSGALRGGANVVNRASQATGIDPRIAANILYQMNQPKGQQ